MSRTRVLIVEDEVIVAESLGRNLEAAGYEVIGHAMNGKEAIHMARVRHPDVVLMDVVLRGDTNGIEAAMAIQHAVDTTIVYVTGYSSDALLRDAARSGAFGYVIKPFQARQVASTITIALQRRSELRALAEQNRPGHATSHSLPPDQGRGPHKRGHQAPATIQALSITPREREVIQSLIRYRRLARVAEVLGISVHTARNHLKSVFRKVNLHSQEELLEYLLDEDQPSDSLSRRRHSHQSRGLGT